MASIKSLLQDTVGQLVFKEFVVAETRALSTSFRRFRISGESLRNRGCAPGDKLQVMVPDGGPRTFTPFGHDGSQATVDILAYVHGDAPASRWARAAEKGTSLRGFGPRGSLPLASLAGPVVFFGDETSFGTAASLRAARGPANGLTFVFECTEPDEAEQVLAELELAPHDIVRRQPGAAHVTELEARIRTALAHAPNTHLVLTGHAQTIQALRARFKAQPVAYASQKVKAYWADGKQGLD